MAAHFNVADIFEMVVDEVPERTALVCGDYRSTYKQLEERANRLADYLRQQGIGAGDHVGLYLYNYHEYIEGMMACFKLRAVPININYRYVAEELLYLFDNADIKAVIYGREFAPLITELYDQLPLLKTLIHVQDGTDAQLNKLDTIDYPEALEQGSPARNFEERSDDDWFIVYTGGTTGMPKGVIWPHKGLIFGGLGGLGHYTGKPIETPEEAKENVHKNPMLVMLPLAPLMHGACWWAAIIALSCGQRIVLNPARSLNGEEVWELVAREEVSSISLVGDAMAIPLLDALKANPDRWEFPSLINIGSGGAVFSNWVQQDFQKIFPDIYITNVFGSSETGFQGGDNGQKSDGLGRIERGPHANVITEDHRIVEPGSGEQGYLARSGATPIGYYKDPKKTAETFITIDGTLWVLTGDLSTVDSDGTIIVYGRGANCINSGGEKIFPEEVEQAVKSHPSVFDALVVGVPDPRFTQRVAAVVHLRSGTTIDLMQLQTECRKHVAGYKVPRELHVIDHIGRAPSGKPDYFWARKVVADGGHHVETQAVN